MQKIPIYRKICEKTVDQVSVWTFHYLEYKEKRCVDVFLDDFDRIQLTIFGEIVDNFQNSYLCKYEYVKCQWSCHMYIYILSYNRELKNTETGVDAQVTGFKASQGKA